MKLIKTNNYIFLLSISFVIFSTSYSSNKEITKTKVIIFEGSSIFENPHPHWKHWKKTEERQIIDSNNQKKSQHFLINILLQFKLLAHEREQLTFLARFIDQEPTMVNMVLNTYKSKYCSALEEYYKKHPSAQEQINNHK